MAGLTDTGFEPKTLTEIITERQVAYRAAFGVDTNVSVRDPDSVAGREIAIESEREVLVWELLQALYLALDVGTAGGVLLDRLADISGLSRNAATPTIVTLILTGTPGAVIPAGSVAATESGIQFTLDSDVTLDGMGDGSGAATAVEPGAVFVDGSSITEIVSFVVGWSTVTNSDGVTGTDTETDTELRARIIDPTTNSPDGRSPYDALLTQLLDIDQVQFATIVVNADDFVDADGRPAHSFEVVLYGAGIDPVEIAETIWRHQLVGGRSYGSSSGPVTDAGGKIQTVYWSLATNLYMEITADIVKYASLFPVDGAAQIRTAIQEYVDGLQVGADVSPWSIILAINGIPGIKSGVITLRKKATGSFTSNVYTPETFEKPLIQTASTDVDVNVT